MKTPAQLLVAGALAGTLALISGCATTSGITNSKTGQAVRVKAGEASASFKETCQKPVEELTWVQRKSCQAVELGSKTMKAGKNLFKKGDDTLSGAIKGGPKTPANE